MAEVSWQARRVDDGVLVDVTADVDGTAMSAPSPNPLEAGGSGLTVDNQADPPAAVSTLVAPGATITGDEASLADLRITTVSATDDTAVMELEQGEASLNADSVITLQVGSTFLRIDEDDFLVKTPFGVTIQQDLLASGIRVVNADPNNSAFADAGTIALDTAAGLVWVKRSSGSSTNWKRIPYQAAAVEDLPNPATATAEDVANTLNELLGALRFTKVIES